MKRIITLSRGKERRVQIKLTDEFDSCLHETEPSAVNQAIDVGRELFDYIFCAIPTKIDIQEIDNDL